MKRLSDFLLSIESDDEKWRKIKCTLVINTPIYKTNGVSSAITEIMSIGQECRMGTTKISTCINGINSIEIDLCGYTLFYHCQNKELRNRTKKNWGDIMKFCLMMFKLYDAELIINYNAIKFNTRFNIISQEEIYD